MVDLSHLNEAGFWDVARLSTAPSSPPTRTRMRSARRRATSPTLSSTRSAPSGGVVGRQLRGLVPARGRRPSRGTPLEEIVRHVDYIAGRIGIDHVAFGSDFDGALVPESLGGIARPAEARGRASRGRIRRGGRREGHAPQLAARPRRHLGVAFRPGSAAASQGTAEGTTTAPASIYGAVTAPRRGSAPRPVWASRIRPPRREATSRRRSTRGRARARRGHLPPGPGS